jgi:tetratricopeptide (TPR) repeat protein
MERQRHQLDVRLTLLAGMLVVTGTLVFVRERPVPVSSAPFAAVSGARLPPGSVDQRIGIYQGRLKTNPRDTASWNGLAVSYARKMRATGDVNYALRAEQALHRALGVDPRDPESAELVAYVALIKHEFADARQQARALIQRAPDDDRLWGILGDADVELGRYGEAERAFQRMMDLRPGPAVYSRVSYLRELHGDVAGAIEMMQLALDEASPDREGQAWIHVHLGHLYFRHGELGTAEHQYQQALRSYPSYLYALAGLGDVRAAQRRFGEAAEQYERALAIVPIPSLAAVAGDIYTRMGRREDAKRWYRLVEFVGHLSQLHQSVFNRDIAYFYADHDRHLGQSLATAHREAALRDDIYTDDVLAWAYFKAGRQEDAARMIHRTLRLGTQDALLFYHAGMIAWKRGDRAQAALYLAKALRTNPYFHVLHADTARRLLQDLRH